MTYSKFVSFSDCADKLRNLITHLTIRLFLSPVFFATNFHERREAFMFWVLTCIMPLSVVDIAGWSLCNCL